MSEFYVPKYMYRVVKVDRIIDGDTIDVLLDLGFHIHILKRIRFKHIDTWEMRGGTEETKEKARKAAARLGELLNMGTVYLQTYMDAEGKYGRLLGDMYVMTADEKVIDVTQTLVAEGYSEDKGGEILQENIQYLQ